MPSDLVLSLASLRLNKVSLQRSLSLKSFGVTVGSAVVLDEGQVGAEIAGFWSSQYPDAESPGKMLSWSHLDSLGSGMFIYKLRLNCVTVCE